MANLKSLRQDAMVPIKILKRSCLPISIKIEPKP